MLQQERWISEEFSGHLIFKSILNNDFNMVGIFLIENLNIAVIDTYRKEGFLWRNSPTHPLGFIWFLKFFLGFVKFKMDYLSTRMLLHLYILYTSIIFLEMFPLYSILTSSVEVECVEEVWIENRWNIFFWKNKEPSPID